jgi:hypothetical protein
MFDTWVAWFPLAGRRFARLLAKSKNIKVVAAKE